MKVYLDHSATTQLDPEVLSAMLPYFTNHYGNAHSLHSYGREASKAVEDSREIIAKCINAKSNEIYFTSGGTESDNWAIIGAIKESKNKNKHVISTVIEHPAVLETLYAMEKIGVKVDFVGVNSDGFVELSKIKELVTDDTILISVMTANNEIGTIQPIAEIGNFCAENGILFHTDAVQAMESINVDVKEMNIDLMSISAHKFNGPKGIGILYIKNGVKLARFISGGHQERKQRAGTTNTPSIVGMAKALQMAVDRREVYNNKVGFLRDYFVREVLKKIPHAYINGSLKNRLPNNANFSFDFIEGEALLIQLDLNGICASSGSACAAGSLEPSQVILSLGVDIVRAHSSIRFSLGKETTKAEIDYTIEKLIEVVKKLRSWSPLFYEEKGEGIYV